MMARLTKAKHAFDQGLDNMHAWKNRLVYLTDTLRAERERGISTYPFLIFAILLTLE